MQQIATVSELHIFPIKSCAGLSVDKALVTNLGLALIENPEVRDRKWMLVDEKGSFVTQRQIPKMALIKVKVEKNDLILTGQDMPDLHVPISPPKIQKTAVWESHLKAHAYGGEVSKWLNKYLERDNLDLVGFSNDVETRKLCDSSSSKKAVDLKENDQVLYADYAPFMLLSEASIEDLNSRLTTPVTVKNFRPNILVKGCPVLDEDNWKHFKISDVSFRNIKHGTRCLLTTVDPNKGIKDKNEEPLKTLKTQNIERYGVSPLFGINLATDLNGGNNIISVNDPIFS